MDLMSSAIVIEFNKADPSAFQARNVSRIVCGMLFFGGRVQFRFDSHEFNDDALLCDNCCELLQGSGVYAVRGELRYDRV